MEGGAKISRELNLYRSEEIRALPPHASMRHKEEERKRREGGRLRATTSFMHGEGEEREREGRRFRGSDWGCGKKEERERKER